MASKHDAKRASENHWVMQQNMARHKSAQGYVHKPRQAAKPMPIAIVFKPAPVPPAETPTE